MKYRLQDISVVIPTFNRKEDLEITLRSFIRNIKQLEEVLIIDQSPNKKTKNLIDSLKNKKIKYYRSSVTSLTMARNFGVSNISGTSKIIIFLDDDVSLEKDYFQNIIQVFNSHPQSLGVSGYYLPADNTTTIEQKLRKIFFIEHLEENSCKVLSAYCAVYPSTLNRTIDAHWLPGFNMAFKKEVFEKELFDENLSKYALGEDFDFSYRIYKRYGGRLFLTPKAKLTHRVSNIGRYPSKKISYMNQINHSYINFKNFNQNFNEKIRFLWCIFGIGILRSLKFFITRKNIDWLKLRFYAESLFFCLIHLKEIREGRLKELYNKSNV